MTTRQAMAELERLGYQFEMTAAGKIKGTIQGTKPPEAINPLELVRCDRDSAAAYVRERQAGSTVIDIYSVFDAVSIGEAVKAGEARLIDKITYHPQAVNVTIRWEPLNGRTSAALLDTRRETLHIALQSRLDALEVLLDRVMTGDEIDRLNAEYGRIKRLLEGYQHEQ